MLDGELIYALCGLFVFFLIFISMGAELYLVCFRMDEMYAQLSKSRSIILERRVMEDMGLSGRLFIFTTIGTLIVFPKLSIRRGYLDSGDFISFPVSLKNWVRAVSISMMLEAFALIVLWTVGKYCGFI